jgi:hypothetical protein
MKMLCLLLVLLIASNMAQAEEWVVLRKPPETGESAPAGILIDKSSIEILGSGIRRAKVKVDFLSRRLAFETFGPTVLNFNITTKTYDCGKQMDHEESSEEHWIDGSVSVLDLSKQKWYSVPLSHRAAIPDFDFVCRWKPRKSSAER